MNLLTAADNPFFNECFRRLRARAKWATMQAWEYRAIVAYAVSMASRYVRMKEG